MYSEIVLGSDCPPAIGGAHTWLFDVYSRWNQPVDYLTCNPSQDQTERQQQEVFDSSLQGNLKIHRCLRNPEVYSFMSPEFWKTQLQWHREIAKRHRKGTQVRLHSLRAFPEGFSAALYKLCRGGEVVVYAHGEEILISESSRVLRTMARVAYSVADRVIVNSQNTASLVRGLTPKATTKCVHPGVPYEILSIPPPRRLSTPWDGKPIVFCTIARMEPRKNQVAVIRLIRRLRDYGLDCVYICAGTGEQLESLRGEVAKLGLEEHVWFPGRVTDEEKLAIYHASHINIMPSVRAGELIEGFGIVFLEAAAAGIPSICGSNGGQSEAVKNDITGFVVDGSDDEEIERAAMALIESSDLRARMGMSAKLWAAENDSAAMLARIQEALA